MLLSLGLTILSMAYLRLSHFPRLSCRQFSVRWLQAEGISHCSLGFPLAPTALASFSLLSMALIKFSHRPGANPRIEYYLYLGGTHSVARNTDSGGKMNKGTIAYVRNSVVENVLAPRRAQQQQFLPLKAGCVARAAGDSIESFRSCLSGQIWFLFS